jgi:hypothetical protein
VDEKKDQIAREIIASLNAKASGFHKHTVLNEEMISNIAFLVTKEEKPDFEWALDELDTRFSAKINFKLVGPLPPYSFATFEIKKLTWDEITYAKAFLGINGDPKPEEVKQSYHDMAKKLHPDNNPGNPQANKDFEELKKVFDLLYEYSQNGKDLFSIKKLTWEQLNTRS